MNLELLELVLGLPMFDIINVTLKLLISALLVEWDEASVCVCVECIKRSWEKRDSIGKSWKGFHLENYKGKKFYGTLGTWNWKGIWIPFCMSRLTSLVEKSKDKNFKACPAFAPPHESGYSVPYSRSSCQVLFKGIFCVKLEKCTYTETCFKSIR